MTQPSLLAILRRLIKDAQQKIFLIVDNLRVHHAKKVQAWTAKHSNKMELFFLPPYSPEHSPEHSPDEYVNQDIKQELKKKPSPDSQERLHEKLSSYMRSLQRKPKKVKKFF